VTASLSGNAKRTDAVARRTSPMAALADRWIPKLVLSPSIVISLVFVYGFILITGYLSLSNSRLLPRYDFVGLARYRELFDNDVWWTSAANLGWFGIPFIAICIGLGLFLAILLDQQIRNEGALRAVFLYPMALSFIVTGTAWQWILNPDLGFQKVLNDWGWTSFSFGWLGDPDKAIFCIVIAAVWQSTGFVMALFLAGLRGVDSEIFKAAQVDGATLPTIYRKIVIPSMRPVFFSVLLILSHITIKTFDLVIALTAGGPGTSSSLPAIFMYTFSFNRGQLGVGAASSMMMLATVVAVLVPLMYLESRGTRNAA
jgi:glucose/mannose transport system permease protein